MKGRAAATAPAVRDPRSNKRDFALPLRVEVLPMRIDDTWAMALRNSADTFQIRHPDVL
jgi:hypothetical protein